MACAFSALDSTDILIACSVFDGLTNTHESSSITALTPSSVNIEYESLLKISGNFSIIALCSEELAITLDRICTNCDANVRQSSTVFLSSVEIVAAAKRPSRHMLILGMINPALLPSPPASAFTSSILLTTFASPTLEYATILPLLLWMYFSIATLVSMLVTNLFRPISNALAIHSSSVVSGLNFLPSLLTTTSLSASRSSPKPWSSLFAVTSAHRSASSSTVGSGPLDDIPAMPL